MNCPQQKTRGDYLRVLSRINYLRSKFCGFPSWRPHFGCANLSRARAWGTECPLCFASAAC